jgi:nitroreductase
MEINDALKTTGSIREYSNEPVSDAVLYDILDTARFAPSGGNRQAWKVIVVKDASQRMKIRDIYLDAWHDYISHLLAGVIPFSPLASEADRQAALAQRSAAEAISKPDGFPETLQNVPIMLVICADLEILAALDRDLDRYQIVGGASLYPFVWNILLAAREHDLGGVMTTVAIKNEQQIMDVLEIPSTFAVASIVTLGHPQKRHTKLKRRNVQDFTTIDSFNGDVFKN